MTQPNLSANPEARGWIERTATIGNFFLLISIGFLAVTAILIVQDLKRDVVTIEPIEVPKALSDSGYTPGVAGYRLRDALNTLPERLLPGTTSPPSTLIPLLTTMPVSIRIWI